VKPGAERGVDFPDLLPKFSFTGRSLRCIALFVWSARYTGLSCAPDDEKNEIDLFNSMVACTVIVRRQGDKFVTTVDFLNDPAYGGEQHGFSRLMVTA
jgi:hypothetical protein